MPNQYRTWRASLFVAWAAGFAMIVAGCGPSGPQTYPVQGKVVFKGKGGKVQQLAGSKVWLQSVADPSLAAVGEIEDDGSFSLGTYLKEKSYQGVPAGQYKGRIEPPADDEEGKPLRGLIHPRYHDFDKSGITCTVPLAGELVITVSR